VIGDAGRALLEKKFEMPIFEERKKLHPSLFTLHSK
jgi:hypothetical protein